MSENQGGNRPQSEYDPNRPVQKPPAPYLPYGYPPYDEEDEIDLVELGLKIWNGRWVIAKVIGVMFILGLVVALGSPEEFSSEVKLLPEAQEAGGSLGGLGGLASQFGFSAGGASRATDGGIPPSLYPEIARSTLVMAQLMNREFEIPETGEQATLYEYFAEHYETTLLMKMISIPKKLFGWVIQTIFRTGGDDRLTEVDRAMTGREEQRELVRMSGEEWEQLRRLRERISVSMDEETGLLTVSAKMPNGELAANVASETVDLLTEHVTTYRTEKARRDVEFIQGRYDEAEERFRAAQQAMAEFRDENRGQLSAVAQTREQQLQNEYDLTFNLYNTMAQRLEESRINLQEDTPVVSTIQPPAVPDRRSEPKRSLTMIIFMMLGGILGVGYVFVREWIANLREEYPQLGGSVSAE